MNRRNPDTAFFEFGNVYFLNPDRESTAERPLAPYSESQRLGLWLAGSTRRANWLRAAEEAGFYDLKAAVINVLARAGMDVRKVTFKPAGTEGGIFAQALDIVTPKGAVIGRAGIVSEALCRRCDIKVPCSIIRPQFSA